MAGPAHLFTQQITLAELAGRDAYGKPALSEQTTAPARVQPTRRVIRDVTGNEVTVSAVVYTESVITLRHRVWHPGANVSIPEQGKRPVAIDEHVDGRGVTRFRKVWFE